MGALPQRFNQPSREIQPAKQSECSKNNPGQVSLPSTSLRPEQELQEKLLAVGELGSKIRASGGSSTAEEWREFDKAINSYNETLGQYPPPPALAPNFPKLNSETFRQNLERELTLQKLLEEERRKYSTFCLGGPVGSSASPSREVASGVGLKPAFQRHFERFEQARQRTEQFLAEHKDNLDIAAINKARQGTIASINIERWLERQGSTLSWQAAKEQLLSVKAEEVIPLERLHSEHFRSRLLPLATAYQETRYRLGALSAFSNDEKELQSKRQELRAEEEKLSASIQAVFRESLGEAGVEEASRFLDSCYEVAAKGLHTQLDAVTKAKSHEEQKERERLERQNVVERIVDNFIEASKSLPKVGETLSLGLPNHLTSAKVTGVKRFADKINLTRPYVLLTLECAVSNKVGTQPYKVVYDPSNADRPYQKASDFHQAKFKSALESYHKGDEQSAVALRDVDLLDIGAVGPHGMMNSGFAGTSEPQSIGLPVKLCSTNVREVTRRANKAGNGYVVEIVVDCKTQNKIKKEVATRVIYDPTSKNKFMSMEKYDLPQAELRKKQAALTLALKQFHNEGESGAAIVGVDWLAIGAVGPHGIMNSGFAETSEKQRIGLPGIGLTTVKVNDKPVRFQDRLVSDKFYVLLILEYEVSQGGKIKKGRCPVVYDPGNARNPFQVARDFHQASFKFALAQYLAGDLSSAKALVDVDWLEIGAIMKNGKMNRVFAGTSQLLSFGLPLDLSIARVNGLERFPDKLDSNKFYVLLTLECAVSNKGGTQPYKVVYDPSNADRPYQKVSDFHQAKFKSALESYRNGNAGSEVALCGVDWLAIGAVTTYGAMNKVFAETSEKQRIGLSSKGLLSAIVTKTRVEQISSTSERAVVLTLLCCTESGGKTEHQVFYDGTTFSEYEGSGTEFP